MEKSRQWLSAFSQYFVKRFRITLIIFLAFAVLGTLAYNNFLKREGFPSTEVPIAVIQTGYFVDNAKQVNNQITEPIEQAIKDLTEVKKITSTTEANISIIVAEFDEDLTSKEGVQTIKDAIESKTALPDDAELNYQTHNANAIDGENDMIISLYGKKDYSLKKIQTKARQVAESISEIDEVVSAEAIEIISRETNPFTGQSFDFQSGFNRIGFKQDDKLIFRKAVDIGIVKKESVGTIELSEAVKDKVSQIKDEDELKNYKINYSGDFSQGLIDQIGSLESNALSGLLAVVVILLLFIGWRSSIVASLFIPIVLAATFVGLYAIGYTINVISLYALVLVLGLFVDDAIVVIEAIDYHKNKGKKGIKAIRDAIQDIGPADLSGTITTILVFAPMAFLTGVLGDFIQIIPVTVILALSLSIIIALSIVPFFANIFIARTKKHDNTAHRCAYFFCDLINRLSKYVGRFVKWYLSRPVVAIIVFLVSLGLILGGGYYAGQLPFKVFSPPDDTDSMIIQTTFDEDNTIEDTELAAKRIEKALKKEAKKEIESVNYVGATKDQAVIMIELTAMNSRDRTSAEITENLEDEFENFKGANVKVEQMSAGPPTADYQFFVQVYAKDKKVLRKATKDIKKFINKAELANDVEITETAIANLNKLSKINGKQYAEVRAKVSDPENTGVIVDLQKQVEENYNKNKLKKLDLEKNDLGFDQGYQSQTLESFNSALFILGLAIVLLYILLIIQFNSFSLPLLVLLAVPFTFPGLFPALYYTGNAMSFFVLIGMIALAGIVVNNTIMLTDFVRRARQKDASIIDAVSQSIQIRFRPILITSVTTIAAILPLYLDDPFWESMIVTIIYGLISSTILVVIAYPVYFAIIEKVRTVVKDWLKKRFAN